MVIALHLRKEIYETISGLYCKNVSFPKIYFKDLGPK